MSEQDTIVTEVRFSDGEDPYSLYVTPRMEAENLAVRALVQMAPWLLLVLLVFSLLCAFGYSRYITRPIVRLSGIAKKWPGWTSTGSAESGAGTKSGSWDAAWTRCPIGCPPPWLNWRQPTRPCAERSNGSESASGSGRPSFPPPPTS